MGAEVWTNLANALAIQATAKGAATTAAKKGFDAFPITTQQMILFASERDGNGASRSSPVETYTEILGLTNAAYMAQHLHHHLKTRLGLDVWLTSSFCSAVRMASFTATTNDRPEAFSLFSCGPQPLDKKSLTGGTDDAEAADDLMRMQLKVADSTTGLSDKDIKKLTLVRHVVPRDFRALAELFENMAGVTELIFGSAVPIMLMLGSWVHFLTRTGSTTVANLRCLAFQDVTAPSRLGWFVERRIQQYLTSCASCGHIDAVNTTLFDYQAERQHLEDGMFLHPLCPYLEAKLGTTDATRAAASGGGASGRGGSSYPTNAVQNPSGRLFKITSRDVWQVFLDHAKAAPVPNLCCRYHLNGVCTESCFFRASHVALTGKQTTVLGKWTESCRARMPSRQPVDAAKKPKLVGRYCVQFPTRGNRNTTDAPANECRQGPQRTPCTLRRGTAVRFETGYELGHARSSPPRRGGRRFSGGPLARFASKYEYSHYVAGRPSSFAIAFSRSSDVPCTDENDTSNRCDTDVLCRKDTDDAASCTQHT